MVAKNKKIISHITDKAIYFNLFSYIFIYLYSSVGEDREYKIYKMEVI